MAEGKSWVNDKLKVGALVLAGLTSVAPAAQADFLGDLKDKASQATDALKDAVDTRTPAQKFQDEMVEAGGQVLDSGGHLVKAGEAGYEAAVEAWNDPKAAPYREDVKNKALEIGGEAADVVKEYFTSGKAEEHLNAAGKGIGEGVGWTARKLKEAYDASQAKGGHSK
ncbi:MAG: hypothetical protein WCL30_01530 [Pseudomonadota bacterium]